MHAVFSVINQQLLTQVARTRIAISLSTKCVFENAAGFQLMNVISNTQHVTCLQHLASGLRIVDLSHNRLGRTSKFLEVRMTSTLVISGN